MKEITKDNLLVKISESRLLMGQLAAENVSAKITALLKVQPMVNMIFAAAPSQNEFLAALLKKELPWEKINAFHMDEYLGLDAEAPQGFGNFLKNALFNLLPLNSVHYLNGNAADAEEECLRYSELLAQYPADIVCMGIGENTHLAFNDPHVADFNDRTLVKVVDLDQQCRMQQVNDGCFEDLDRVPTHALTLTVPALFKARYVFCIVPGPKKADAVKYTLTADVSEKYPSTILRTHAEAILYLDADSSSTLFKM